MTLKLNIVASFASLACVSFCAEVALAQATAPKPATVPQPAAAVPQPAAQPLPPATVTPAAVPVPTVAQQPAAVPVQPAGPIAVVPPGYALVPIENAAQTRYDVEYPQHQGALPPGMELPYEDGEPVPAGYRVVKDVRRGLVIAGSIVGGIAYTFSVTGAVGDDFNHKSGALMVPVLGPWLMLALGGAKNECKTIGVSTYSSDYCNDNAGLRGMLVLDGLMQLAGATMLTVGIAVPRTRLVRRDVSVSMVPFPLGRDGYGIGAVGQF